jgi:hypothetical protein
VYYDPVRGSGPTYTEEYAHLVDIVLEYVCQDTFGELSGGYVSIACACVLGAKLAGTTFNQIHLGTPLESSTWETYEVNKQTQGPQLSRIPSSWILAVVFRVTRIGRAGTGMFERLGSSTFAAARTRYLTTQTGL